MLIVKRMRNWLKVAKCLTVLSLICGCGIEDAAQDKDNLELLSDGDGCVEPHFYYANCNEWWREFSTESAFTQVQLEVHNGKTYNMQYKWNKWIHGDGIQITSGTMIRLIAIDQGGSKGTTKWFAFMNQNPQPEQCSTSSGTSAKNAQCFEPAFKHANVNQWWREFSSQDSLSKVNLAVKDGKTYTMQYKWNKWILGDGINTPPGTQMRLIARHSSGAEGRTKWFAYMNQEPSAEPCGSVTTKPDADSPSDDSPGTNDSGSNNPPQTTTPSAPANSIVDAHGQLKVVGSQIQDKCGRPVQLRGMSFFWHQWDNSWEIINANVIRWLRDDWKVTMIRVPIGVREGDKCTAYGTQKINNFNECYNNEIVGKTGMQYGLEVARRAIKGAIDAGIYVLVDWHSHNTLPQQAKEFFVSIASEFGHYPNVIYEIFNEPPNQNYAAEIKPYNEELIAVIRDHDPDNIIVAGTEFWSQRVDIAANNPVTHDSKGRKVSNIAYNFHYYAGMHGDGVLNYAKTAIAKGICIFASETGRTSGGPAPINAGQWDIFSNWADQNHVSFNVWSMGQKDEAASCIYPQASRSGNWDSNKDLRDEGRFMRNFMRSKNSIPAACK